MGKTHAAFGVRPISVFGLRFELSPLFFMHIMGL